MKFIKSVAAMMKQVSWPTRPELARDVKIVIQFTVVMAVFLGLVDFALDQIVKALL